jgi:hypothetical protein
MEKDSAPTKLPLTKLASITTTTEADLAINDKNKTDHLKRCGTACSLLIQVKARF